MTENHPMTPTRELVDRLQDLGNLDAIELAYQAGADAELEACCEILRGEFNYHHIAEPLRALRRPKPPSLKEQALALLNKAEDPSWDINDFSIVRKALEQLDD